MFGEFFIDQALTACCSIDDSYGQSKQLFASIFNVLDWYRTEIPKDKYPNEFKDKLDLTFYLSQYRYKNSEFKFNKLVDKIKSGKFKDLIPILENKKVELDDSQIEDILQSVLSKLKLCTLVKGKINFQDLLADIETGNYSDDEEIINRWEVQISKSYQQVVDVKKLESLQNASRLDLQNDDYTSVLEKLRSVTNTDETIKTGYKIIDNKLPSKGFEPRRLYLVGGSSGVGKSAFLANLICNAVKSNKRKEKLDTYLYITAENLIDESLTRFYSCLIGTSSNEVVDRLKNDPTFNLKDDIVKILKETGTNIIFYYIEMNTSTVRDVESICNEVATNHNLKGIYLDYLDLICSGMGGDDLRLDLGYVAMGLKNIAISYQIPVITATQLNRGGYDKNSAPSLTQMSESMKKIDNSDFVLFLQEAANPKVNVDSQGTQKLCKNIRLTVLKNRNGATGESGYLLMPESVGNVNIFNFRIIEKPSEYISNEFSYDDQQPTNMIEPEVGFDDI